MPPKSHPRIDFFEKAAPYYDILIDFLTLGLYAKFLRKAVGILSPKKGEKILDLCSGTGRVASWIALAVGEEGEAVGLDISKSMVEVAKKRYGRSENLIFQQKDVTEPWECQSRFHGIFISFALHELPETERGEVLERCYLRLKEEGRIVIADFNPQISGRVKIVLITFFKLFERGNLNFFSFDPYKILNGVGFKKIETFPILYGILQITLGQC
jgi:demethylmenaquinone methyltransferase/2-methoxy-6-polyprenyl-1,4-benzoquinol methylase